jgi:4-hydroxybenzoate polyprenyltransferase
MPLHSNLSGAKNINEGATRALRGNRSSCLEKRPIASWLATDLSFKDHLVYSRIPIVLGAVLLMIVSVIYTEVPFFSFISIASIACATLAIYSIYSFNSWTDSDEDQVNSPEFAAVGSKSKISILAMSLITGIISAMLSVFLGLLAAATVLFVLLVGLLYSNPALKVVRVPRFKEIPLFKNVIIAILWALLVTVPFSASGTAMNSVISLLILFVFLQFLIESISRDLPDAQGDVKAGFLTIPSVFGLRNTLALLLIINTISVIVIIACSTLMFFTSLILIGCAWRYWVLFLLFEERPLTFTFAKINFPVFLALAVGAILGKLFV